MFNILFIGAWLEKCDKYLKDETFVDLWFQNPEEVFMTFWLAIRYKNTAASLANKFPVPCPPLTETTLAQLFQLWVISGLRIVRCKSRMIFDGIGLFILIHKFDGNLKDTIVGWCTRGNFISGSILTYDFSIESPKLFLKYRSVYVLLVPAKPILNVILFFFLISP